MPGISQERAGMFDQHRKVRMGSVTKPEPVVSEKLLRNTRSSTPLPSHPPDLGLVISSQALPGKDSKTQIIVLRLSCNQNSEGLLTI